MIVSKRVLKLGARLATPLVAAAAIYLAAGAGPLTADQTAPAAPTQQEVGVPPGPAPTLAILFTSQVTGWTEPCG